MNYRKLGRSGFSVSEIGLGSEGYMNSTEGKVKDLVDAALSCGINYFDLFNSEPDVRSNLGAAMHGRRDKFILQGHIGSIWVDGQYKRSREMKYVRPAFEDELARLKTDYIDIGFIHYVDVEEDFETCFNTEFFEYVKELKEKGVIRAVGMSTHNHHMAMKAAQTGLLDVIMMSINPAYDMAAPTGDIDSFFDGRAFKDSALSNIDPEREQLYKLCEVNNVALTVMKPFAGGALLSAQSSPFGVTLTVPQCLHYCLTRPAVRSVLVGAKKPSEIIDAAGYCEKTEEEKDYAAVLSGAPAHRFSDKCMYCGHCAPCTVGIDIAMVNKLADLAETQGTLPETVREHYEALGVKAGACVECRICEKNCPFGVKITEHMKKAVKIFGK